MKKYILPIIIILILSSLFFINTTPESCECKGIGQTFCLGTIECQDSEAPCIPLTCENKQIFLERPNLTQENKEIYTILIIDASKSMEGETLDETVKASKEFVKNIEEHEHVAIIEFNEEAQILKEFTNDKLELYASIDLINPKSKTVFYNPFNLANQLFNSIPKDTEKYILFLSDGTPEDDEEGFMSEIQKIKNKNVNIYTIAFEEKSNEELMKQIASNDEAVFTVTSAQDIEEKFIQIYSNIAEEKDIELNQLQQLSIAKKSDEIALEITSIYSNKSLFDQGNYCDLKTTQYIEAKNKQNEIKRITGIQELGKLIFHLDELDPGDYELQAYTKAKFGECISSATKQLKSIKIINQEECDLSCNNISAIMKGNKNSTYVRNDSQAISWTILLDKSSSMNINQQLEKALSDANIIHSFLPVQDMISIGSFDTKVDLILTHEKPNSFQKEMLENIVLSSSTQLIVALEAFEKLEQNSPLKNNHHIILTDGNFGNNKLQEINNTLQNIKGCITTINYGTHLLKTEEEAFELIREERKCGEDFITKPTREEYQKVIGTHIEYEPKLLITHTIDSEDSTKLHTNVISTFTGEEPKVMNDNCIFEPEITTTITPQHNDSKIITTKTFQIGENDSFSTQVTFGKETCTYDAIKEITNHEEEKESNLLKILLAVLLVLITNLFVFLYVMNKKLSKLEKQFKIK